MRNVQDRKDAGLATVIVTSAALCLGMVFANASPVQEPAEKTGQVVVTHSTGNVTSSVFSTNASGGAMNK